MNNRPSLGYTIDTGAASFVPTPAQIPTEWDWGPDNRPLRILIVYDDDAEFQLLVLLLEKEGYQVEAHRVDNHAELQKALSHSDWDIVISDRQMPGFSGVQALHTVRKLGSDIPFVVISGTIGEETAIDFIRARARDVLLRDRLTSLGPALRRELDEAMVRRSGRDAEEARRNSQACYCQIVEAASEGIFMIDINSRLTFANHSLVEMLGWSHEEMRGRSLFTLVAPEDMAMAQSCWSRPPLKGGERLEVKLVKANGTSFWTRILVNACQDHQGTWVGSLGMVTDITDRRTLQDQILQSEVEKKRYCRQALQAVTRGKFHLVDAGDLPTEGRIAVEIALDSEENYRRLLRRVREVSEEQGLNPEAAGDFALAVGEAATNVIKHARQGLGQVRLPEGRIVARISDQGSGMRAEDIPAAVLQPGFSTAVSLGMGYTIILELVDAVWLSSGFEGTVVQLEKSLFLPEVDLSFMDRFV